MGKIHSVLLVCTGNSCRSVMAEGLLKKRLKELGKTDIVVRSAGTGALQGYPPMAETIKVMEEAGVDLSNFESTSINDELISESDLILAMSTAHRAEIIRRVPEAAAKAFLLSEYGRSEQDEKLTDPDIPDPIGLSITGYKVCLEILKKEIERVAKLL